MGGGQEMDGSCILKIPPFSGRIGVKIQLLWISISLIALLTLHIVMLRVLSTMTDSVYSLVSIEMNLGS